MDPRHINNAPPPLPQKVKAGSATARGRKVEGEEQKKPARKKPRVEKKEEPEPIDGEKGGLLDITA